MKIRNDPRNLTKRHEKYKRGVRLTHQRRGAPENRRLAMQIAHAARTFKVEFQLRVDVGSYFEISFVGSDADVVDVRVFVDVLDQTQPGFARCWPITLA